MTTGTSQSAGFAAQHARDGRPEDVSLAVNAFLAARRPEDRAQALAVIQKRHWRLVHSALEAVMARRRGQPEFTEDERLLVDLGLVDARMPGAVSSDRAGPDQERKDLGELGEEIRSKGFSGCFYLSEWLAERLQQRQNGLDIDSFGGAEENAYASQLGEARRRVLARLSEYFTALPGVPLELADAVRSGDLSRAVIAAGIGCLREPTRKNFLKRHKLWTLRDQVMGKARARVADPGALKLFDVLNEVYARDWRTRYDSYVAEGDAPAEDPEPSPHAASGGDTVVIPPGRFAANDAEAAALLGEARQMRTRIVLMSALDGQGGPDTVLASRAPRMTKTALARFVQLAQTFDRTLADPPPFVIVPGSGRGFFAWDEGAGCVMLALRPVVGVDDSAATALAWRHMLDDRFNRGGVLRSAYEKRFPGAVFRNDFPADYRTWLCRLPKGETYAMQDGRRAFFHEFIGPDLTGAFLPPNLRSVAPQTMAVICRRLEKQIAADEGDANIHRRLAAIYWQQGEIEAAGLQFNAAMQTAPDDGETLFTAGLFMRGQNDDGAAKECFKFGAERASKSMWGVYCKDALAGII